MRILIRRVEQDDERSQVRGAGQVETGNASAVAQHGHRHPLLGLTPDIPRDPSRGGLGPFAEVEPPDHRLFRRHATGFGDLLAQVLATGNAIGLPFQLEIQARVDLGPAVFAQERVITFVQAADESEEAVVFFFAGADPRAQLMVLPANAVLVRAAVGDHHNQRLLPVLGTGAHHVHDSGGFVLVDLIEQRHVWTRAGLAVVGADRFEERSGVRVVQVPHLVAGTGLVQPRTQVFRQVDHGHGIAEQDHGLILFRGGGVNLSASFAVRDQAVQADASRQG